MTRQTKSTTFQTRLAYLSKVDLDKLLEASQVLLVQAEIAKETVQGSIRGAVSTIGVEKKRGLRAKSAPRRSLLDVRLIN